MILGMVVLLNGLFHHLRPYTILLNCPHVTEKDQFWVNKEHHLGEGHVHPKDLHFHPIHMPKNTPAGFVIAIFAGVMGFALVWHMWIPCLIGFSGMLITFIARTFNTDTDYFIDSQTVKEMELAHLKEEIVRA